MNTSAQTHRIQTTCALGFALLFGGTASASHRSEIYDGPAHHQGYESYSKSPAGCAAVQAPRLIIFDHSFRQVTPSCNRASDASSTAPAVRLARPLSGRSYNHTSENIRYSF